MRRRGLGSVLLGLGAVLTFILGFETTTGQRLASFVLSHLYSSLAHQAFDLPHSWLGGIAWRAMLDLLQGAQAVTPAALALGCVAAMGGLVARSVARVRVGSGKTDPLDRLRTRAPLRRALTATPAALAALPVLVAGVLALRESAYGNGSWLQGLLGHLLADGALVALLYGATRLGMRALLAPLDAGPPALRDAGDIVFSAVAVTARTRGAVGGFAAATVAMVALTLSAPGDPSFQWLLSTYVAAAIAVPFVFRRVSRIAVGVDGVWVRDASHAHFFAYRDLDDVRARGADLELVRAGRFALRLQMHGEDAGRRDEVIARVRDGIARSRESASRGAELVVQAVPTRQVVAATRGADSYRRPSISRDQLWELVEGPSADASTRRAAAEALAAALDDTDRARLRIAAAHCAEPRLRIALGALASGDDDDDEGAAQETDATPHDRGARRDQSPA